MRILPYPACAMHCRDRKHRSRRRTENCGFTGARLPSSNGKSYSERIDAATTEKQLSDIFEDFIGMVPLAKTFLASRNPIRTGGPMQVSIAFAEGQAASARYPYPIAHSIRHEVFTRGGMYFGIAHLLGTRNSTTTADRFADFTRAATLAATLGSKA